MDDLAAATGVTVAGGDVTSSPALVLAVTAVGRALPGVDPVRRAGARAGDVLCVTGRLGAAAAGLRLLEDPGLLPELPERAALVAAQRRPEPRLLAGRRLAEGGATAMMDLSDGLALDAGRLAAACGLHAAIDLAALPVAPGVAEVAAGMGADPPDWRRRRARTTSCWWRSRPGPWRPAGGPSTCPSRRWDAWSTARAWCCAGRTGRRGSRGRAGGSMRSDAAPALEARGLTLSLGDVPVLDRVDLRVAPGEIVALVGPSGCGKSTLLSVLAGLLAPDAGEVLLDGRPAPARLGTLTLMPQRDALLPWRTLEDNVAMAATLAGAPGDEAARAARAALARFGLSGFGDHYPHALSGGMRQRGALARTLLSAARVWLLDEPFGALDALTRSDLQGVLGATWRSAAPPRSW